MTRAARSHHPAPPISRGASIIEDEPEEGLLGASTLGREASSRNALVVTQKIQQQGAPRRSLLGTLLRYMREDRGDAMVAAVVLAQVGVGTHYVYKCE